MDCHQFEELAGAYALGATSENERRYAQAHLATCANCSRMVREFQEITDLLPLTAPQIEPSPALHTRVMAAVEADAQAFKQNWQSARQTQSRSWWRNWQMRIALAVIIVLLVCVGGLAAWNINLQQSTGQIYTYGIQGTPQDATASGKAIYIPQDQMNMIIVHNLPRLQGTQVYQGWLITSQQVPQSIGLLRVVNGTAILGFAGDLPGYSAIAVSIEPGPQASPVAPAGPIVAEGKLQQGQIGLLSGQDRLLYQYLKQTEGQG